MNNCYLAQIILLILCINLNKSIVFAHNNSGLNITGILNSFAENGYDMRFRPNYGGAAVVVSVSMYIFDISSISESQMDFTSKFYFGQYWLDDRLAFSSTSNLSELVIESEVLEKIWVPDTFFHNEKSSAFHKITKPNIYIRIESNGRVFTNQRLTLTATCSMHLQYFPMDRQKCKIRIGSYGHNEKNLIYVWYKEIDSTGILNGLELPQFKIVGYRITNRTLRDLSNKSALYSHLIFEILFERFIGYYLIQVYIPASLIVIISWIPFWLDRHDSHARIALGVTTLLTITTLMTNINESLPKVSYIKAIDVFLEFCFLMVFGALLEYASVGYIMKRSALRGQAKQQFFNRSGASKSNIRSDLIHDSSLGEIIMTKTTHKLVENSLQKKPENKLSANFIPEYEEHEKVFGITATILDKYSCLLFPICFVCFNLFYWVYYLSVSKVSTKDFVLK